MRTPSDEAINAPLASQSSLDTSSQTRIVTCVSTALFIRVTLTPCVIFNVFEIDTQNDISDDDDDDDSGGHTIRCDEVCKQ